MNVMWLFRYAVITVILNYFLGIDSRYGGSDTLRMGYGMSSERVVVRMSLLITTHDERDGVDGLRTMER